MIFFRRWRFLMACMPVLLAFLPNTSWAERGDILDYSLFGITPVHVESAQDFLEPEVRSVCWGMTPEMVIERDGVTSHTPMNRGSLLYISVPATSVANIPCSLTYIFTENALSGISCAFYSDTFRLDEDITHFLRLEALLTEKYGTPLEKRCLWENSESPYREDPNAFGMAVAMGDLRYQTEWNTGISTIHLNLEGEHFRPRLTLRYQSTRLAEKENEAARKVLLSEL